MEALPPQLRRLVREQHAPVMLQLANSMPDLTAITSTPDCHSASQVVVTSPQPESNLSIIGPRIIVAWLAGTSGIAAYFAPENGINGTLGINIINSTSSKVLKPIYESNGNESATVGVAAQVEFNSSATLSVANFGSIRTIRDFSGGPSLLGDVIQGALKYREIENIEL